MGIRCLKILFFIFTVLSIVSLSFGVLEFWSFGVLEFWSFGVLEFWSFGVYIFDVIIISIGILFIFAGILIALELKQRHSSPFRRD